MPTSEVPVLDVRGLSAAYGDLGVLWDISIELAQREIICVLGANCAGKTTLLRAIAGLHRVTTGSVRLQGRQIDGLKADRVARAGVALVSDRTVFPTLSISENLSLGRLATRGRGTADMLGLVDGLFPALLKNPRKLAGELSGGQRQMLAIGRALMGDPKVLLLDEPSTGIAPVVVQGVFSAINQMRDSGISVLLVDQFVHDALSIADRAYVIQRGRVVMQGSGTELATDPRLVEAYLGATS